MSAATRARGPSEASVRMLVKIGAVSTVCGIVLAVADDQGVSILLTLGGVLLLVWGLHRFGRLGADARVRHDDSSSDG
ncbi:MAG: hypothetical protein QM756_13530 [Polyangiaceae bacterium]